MTYKNIRKKAKFLLKQTKGKTDFVSIEQFLKTIGYTIVFFNTPIGDQELERFEIPKSSITAPAFTCSFVGKVIFIDNEISADDKNYLLYHEVGHILLNHIDYDRIDTKNNYLMEFEADTFAHLIVNPPKTNKAIFFMAFLLILTASVSFYADRVTAPDFIQDTLPAINQTSPIIQQPTEHNTALVCVTRTGKKYHKETCRYIKNGYIKISLTDAEKLYSPCSVCNP